MLTGNQIKFIISRIFFQIKQHHEINEVFSITLPNSLLKIVINTFVDELSSFQDFDKNVKEKKKEFIQILNIKPSGRNDHWVRTSHSHNFSFKKTGDTKEYYLSKNEKENHVWLRYLTTTNKSDGHKMREIDCIPGSLGLVFIDDIGIQEFYFYEPISENIIFIDNNKHVLVRYFYLDDRNTLTKNPVDYYYSEFQESRPGETSNSNWKNKGVITAWTNTSSSHTTSSRNPSTPKTTTITSNSPKSKTDIVTKKSKFSPENNALNQSYQVVHNYNPFLQGQMLNQSSIPIKEEPSSLQSSQYWTVSQDNHQYVSHDQYSNLNNYNHPMINEYQPPPQYVGQYHNQKQTNNIEIQEYYEDDDYENTNQQPQQNNIQFQTLDQQYFSTQHLYNQTKKVYVKYGDEDKEYQNDDGGTFFEDKYQYEHNFLNK